MKKIIPLLLLLLATITHAQSYKIIGQIVDDKKESIPYATLSLSKDSLNNNVLSRQAADVDGRFTFEIKQSGTYYIVASFMGKQDLKKTIEINSNDLKTDLGLLEMQNLSEELAGVTITAQKPLVKIDIDKLVYNTQDDPESQTSNALDMLRKVPLITIDGDDKISVKGSGSYKVLVNGKPSNMFSNNPEKVFKGMPASSIKNVEVITEPGAKYDAEGVSAIINIITEKNSIDGYTGSISSGINNLGSYDFNLNLSLKYGKIGFTGNGNYYTWKQPEANSSSINETYSPYTNRIESTSRNKYDGKGLWGNAQLSYEIDSLNLLNLSYSRYSGDWDNKTRSSVESSGQMIYSYDQSSKNNTGYGGGDITLDYQKSFMKPGKLLTVSYKLGQSPYETESDANTENIINPNGDFTRTSPFRTNNDAKNTEHTGQIDYVNPLTEKHSIEAGTKYIHRNNSSKGFYYTEDASGEYIEDPVFSDRNRLTQKQNVLSGYGSYQYKIAKFAAKGGIRFDYTTQNLDFASDPTVKTDYLDFIPSAVLSYQLAMTKTIKGTYNMGIRRPGIWQLNPYENTMDSIYISKGNPNLDSERSHSFSLIYSSFNPKFVINASLGYNWTSNAMVQIEHVEDRNNKPVTISTYENIGKNQRVSGNLYFNWNPNTKLRLYSNISTNYLHFDRTGINALSNGGWQTYAYVGGSYNLPKDFRFNFGGSIYQYGVGLQSEKAITNYTTYLSLSKDFLNKKLTANVSAQDPFWYKTTMTSTSKDATFWRQSKYDRIGQSFRISISYRFGELKSNIKKVQRTISNDDVSGGSGAQGGGGQPSK